MQKTPKILHKPINKDLRGSKVKYTSVPTRVINSSKGSRMGKFPEFHNYNSGNMRGLRTGIVSCFLSDLVSPDLSEGDEANSTRIIMNDYIHPDMAVGPTSNIASQFQKYKLLSLTIHYTGELGSDFGGELFIIHVTDPTIDPSVLRDRQLKTWAMTLNDKWKGSVFQPKDITKHFTIDPQEWHYISRAEETLQDVFCGKLYVIASGTPHKMLGDVTVDFSFIFANMETSIQQIASVVSSHGNAFLSQEIKAYGGTVSPGAPISVVVPSGQPIYNAPSGLYSFNVKEENPGQGGATSENFLDKLYNYGSEFILSMIGAPGQVRTAKLFNSMTDFMDGNVTKSGRDQTLDGAPMNGQLIPLLVNAVKSIFTVSDGTFPRKLTNAKGYIMMMEEHNEKCKNLGLYNQMYDSRGNMGIFHLKMVKPVIETGRISQDVEVIKSVEEVRDRYSPQPNWVRGNRDPNYAYLDQDDVNRQSKTVNRNPAL